MGCSALTLGNASYLHCFLSVQLDIRCVLVFLLALRTTSIWTAIPKVNSNKRRNEEPERIQQLSSAVFHVVCFMLLPFFLSRIYVDLHTKATRPLLHALSSCMCAYAFPCCFVYVRCAIFVDKYRKRTVRPASFCRLPPSKIVP